MFIHLSDVQEPPLKRLKQSDNAVLHEGDALVSSPVHHSPKALGAKLKQEYELARFVQNISKLHSSWNTATPACDWKGITCNNQTEVTRIDWSLLLEGYVDWNLLPRTVVRFDGYGNDKLTGTLPLDSLPSQFDYLMLYDCAFQGILDLSRMPASMTSLGVGKNQFHGTLDLTVFPAGMQVFTAPENQFTGEIDLSQLPSKMMSIALSRNGFTGTPDLEHLPPKMEMVCLDYNEFSGKSYLNSLPESMWMLDLDCNYNLTVEYDDSKFRDEITLASHGVKFIVHEDE